MNPEKVAFGLIFILFIFTCFMVAMFLKAIKRDEIQEHDDMCSESNPERDYVD